MDWNALASTVPSATLSFNGTPPLISCTSIFRPAFFACSDSAMCLQMSASEPTEAILTVLSPESDAFELCELAELEALFPQAPKTNAVERAIRDLAIVFNFI